MQHKTACQSNGLSGKQHNAASLMLSQVAHSYSHQFMPGGA